MKNFLLSFFKPSARAFFTEKVSDPQYSFMKRLHGYIYARWPFLYISVGTGRHPLTRFIKPAWRVVFGNSSKKFRETTQGKINFAHGYHGKALTLQQAGKLVKVDKSINLGDLEQVVPYNRAREIVLKNPDHIVALQCPCRSCRDNPCLPLDVCLIIGEPFASFILEHHPDKTRKITQKEAAEILEEEHKRGHVQHAFFKDAMLDRFYAICNCCSCCCGAMQAHRNGVPMLASSGYTAVVNHQECQGCGKCAKNCQFHAISIRQKKAVIDTAACLGCGVCNTKCSRGCLSLKRDLEKCPPLEVQELIRSVPGSTCATGTGSSGAQLPQKKWHI
ncbi:DUF362 domain-containing protein [Desulfonatronovibrio magnus]|uniref:DUF362 domain-containing protein n=1 Tax=Desulfonatronovibrio magnus TaxID=698827 RepID=UPI0005EB5D40|nr:4Fe-4S binding protein [Desulfonatronovibrio magnus]